MEQEDWKKALRKYLIQYRAIPLPTTGRSPAELLYNRQIRTKMPMTFGHYEADQEVRDHDSEQKSRAKLYADMRKGVKECPLNVGDRVLMRQEKRDKLTHNSTQNHAK